MGKSLEFVKNRIISGEYKGMDSTYYMDLKEANFWNRVFTYFKFGDDVRISENTISFASYFEENGTEIKRIAMIKYNPNADFEYFTLASCMCDGTLSLFLDLHGDILDSLIYGTTYYKPKAPKNFEEEFYKYDMNYVVGDFVYCYGENRELAPKDKPWMTTQFTLMLPIAMEFVERETRK